MKIYVKDSAQHGRGVFAAAPIRAGEAIIQFTGAVLTRAEVREDDYHLQIGDELYMGASGAADDYVNHSCDPNSGFRDDLLLVARRDIAPDEEITWDYSTAIDEGNFAGFPCCCGAAHCRGRVQSFRHLDPATRERLRPWALPFLRGMYLTRDDG